MSARRRGVTSRNKKIAGGLLAAVVAAGMAYAAPYAAGAATEAAAAPSGAASHHLSTRLAALVTANRAGLDQAETAAELGVLQTGAGSLLRTPDGRLVVDVRLSSYDAAKVAAVKAAGAEIVHRNPGLRQVTVAVAPQDLPAVGDAPGGEYVGEELTPQVSAVCDGTISEGDAILKANQLRATGVDGTGVKVGVMSDSYDKSAGAFTHAAGDIASDNLPGAANTCGHTSVSTVADAPGAGSDEGRGMMQIVHDLAPGSPLDSGPAFTGEPSFASTTPALASRGAKVIVDDVTYFDEPMYQDGIVEQAVTGVRAQGVDYFSSSANNRYVKNGHEVGSYETLAYRPTTCPASITGHADCHNFGTVGAPDNTFSYTANNNQIVRALLAWAEPWNGGVNTDLDIYLVDQTTNTAPIKVETVNAGALGDQHAFEFLGVQHGVSADTFGIVVARKSSAPPAATPRFKMVFAENGANPFATLEHEVPVAGTTDVMGPTVFGHNGGADVMSVGASDVRVATNLNSYSSYGPVTPLFGPVNGVTPAAPLASPKVVAKPDLVANDCNVTTFFAGAGPPFHFCGTSAAAPHAAAVAALLRQKFPTATAASINTAMITTATPIAGVPASFQGGGLVNAQAAPAAVVVPPPPPTPDTIITKAPKKTIKTTKHKVKVSFSFTSTVAGSTFTCSLDGKAFAPCTSGVTF